MENTPGPSKESNEENITIDFSDTSKDGDRDDLLPENEQLLNRANEKITFSSKDAILYIDSAQQVAPMKSEEFEQKIRTAPSNILFLGSQALDFYMSDEGYNKIPQEWKGKTICFMGSIYKNKKGRFIRVMNWVGNGWRQGVRYIDTIGEDVVNWSYERDWDNKKVTLAISKDNSMQV